MYSSLTALLLLKTKYLAKRQGMFHKITSFIIWLAPWAGNIKQIAHCDWLPEQARGTFLAHSGPPALSREKNFPENQTINPLVTKPF